MAPVYTCNARVTGMRLGYCAEHIVRWEAAYGPVHHACHDPPDAVSRRCSGSCPAFSTVKSTAFTTPASPRGAFAKSFRDPRMASGGVDDLAARLPDMVTPENPDISGELVRMVVEALEAECRELHRPVRVAARPAPADRIIVLPVKAPRHSRDIYSVFDFSDRWRSEIERFFLATVAFEDKEVKVLG